MLLRFIHFWFLTVLLVSCSSSTSLPANTPDPTNTRTPTENIQPFATSTIEPTLTNTPTPQKTSLSGFVFLTDPAQRGGWPLASYVELLSGHNIKVAKYPDENRPLVFIFENIEPGTYQLWVLIPPDTLSMKNCYDVGLPDKTWKLGKIVDNDRLFVQADRSYREGFLQAWADYPTDQKTREFYAVMESLDIKPGIDNFIDVTFICKDR
jgi:hypothetical protein